MSLNSLKHIYASPWFLIGILLLPWKVYDAFLIACGLLWTVKHAVPCYSSGAFLGGLHVHEPAGADSIQSSAYFTRDNPSL